jgi:hypothetical protein
VACGLERGDLLGHMAEVKENKNQWKDFCLGHGFRGLIFRIFSLIFGLFMSLVLKCFIISCFVIPLSHFQLPVLNT